VTFIIIGFLTQISEIWESDRGAGLHVDVDGRFPERAHRNSLLVVKNSITDILAGSFCHTPELFGEGGDGGAQTQFAALW